MKLLSFWVYFFSVCGDAPVYILCVDNLCLRSANEYIICISLLSKKKKKVLALHFSIIIDLTLTCFLLFIYYVFSTVFNVLFFFFLNKLYHHKLGIYIFIYMSFKTFNSFSYDIFLTHVLGKDTLLNFQILWVLQLSYFYWFLI